MGSNVNATTTDFPEHYLNMPNSNSHDGPGNARAKPIRVTVDLDPGDYDTLREFAFRARMTHTDVMRSLVRLLASEPIGEQVRHSTAISDGATR
jgi:hypothetical protein